MSAAHNFNQCLLGFQLRSISIKEITLLNHAPAQFYRFENGEFVSTIRAHDPINRDLLIKLLESGFTELFIEQKAFDEIQNQLGDLLVKNTRSLSIGEPSKKAKRQLGLLNLNMQNLYQNPLDDNSLELQFKGTQNFAQFLAENKNIIPRLYADTKKFNSHYIIAQPFLSSILTLGYLHKLGAYQDREIEMLFLTSMFKDIGMSFIPDDKYVKADLDQEEKKLFASHAIGSKELLKGRIPLSRNYLDIIENHHFLNEKIAQVRKYKKNVYLSNDEKITGIETVVISIFDVIVAMLEGRPYAKKLNLFDALELAKYLMENEYPQEFRLLVHFLRRFFK